MHAERTHVDEDGQHHNPHLGPIVDGSNEVLCLSRISHYLHDTEFHMRGWLLYGPWDNITDDFAQSIDLHLTMRLRESQFRG